MIRNPKMEILNILDTKTRILGNFFYPKMEIWEILKFKMYISCICNVNMGIFRILKMGICSEFQYLVKKMIISINFIEFSLI